MLIRLFIPVYLLMVLFSCSQKKAIPAVSINEVIDSTSVADPPFIPPMRYSNDTITCIIEPYPEFPGGEEALTAFLKKNLKYPKEALRQQKSGTVFVGFIIDENGKLSDFEVKNKRIGFGLEEEALRVLKLMPNWKPRLLNGKPSTTWYTMPIRFAYSEQKQE